jgi:tetratricopeptide (TPR) repeat protein
MDAAGHAVDRDQAVWQVPSIAATLANTKAPDKAEQLYQRLFGLVESWSADTLQPILNVLQNYPRFLMQQQDRWPEVPGAIERYRSALTTARGEGTGWLEEALRLSIDFERAHGSQARALSAAQDLLTLEESLNGNTSEPYLRAAETLAEVCESTGDSGRALPLRRQTVAIADLVFPASDARRGYIRIQVALALARQRQFDEAERLANEALAIGETMRPPQANSFAQQLEQIRQMKAAPQSVGRPNMFRMNTDTNGTIRWFDTQTFRPVQGNATPPAGKPSPEKKPEKQDR